MTSSIEIRPALPADADKLLQFLLSDSDQRYWSMAKDEVRCAFSDDFRRPHFLIAMEGDEIIGTAAYSEELFSTHVWGVSWMHVRPDRRNRGLGSALLEACLAHIATAANGSATVILNAWESKLGFYERLGFVKIGLDHKGGCLMTRII